MLVILTLALLALPAPAQVILTEFLASNESGIKDADGDFSDWIEVHNPTTAPVNLAGWTLTDNAADRTKWRFPAISLTPGGYLVVFASDKNRADPEAELHTNFKLSASGEYLALTAPDGTTATEFAPIFPPQFPNISYGLPSGSSGNNNNNGNNGQPPAARYFTTPTPGAANGTGTGDLGPVITAPTHTPARPAPGQSLNITARIAPTLAPLGAITLRWVVMYPNASNPVRDLPMRDDGQNGDATANDGLFTAILPGTLTDAGGNVTTNTFATGRLIRWYFQAADTAGHVSEWPLYPDPLNSARYLGTVSQDAPDAFNPAHPAGLPVWYWFAENTANVTSRAGTRGAVFFRDRLYDNIFIRARGAGTAGASKKFDFNSGDHCFIDDFTGSVEEANLNESDDDPTLIRPSLSFEVFRKAGAPACNAFPVLLRGAYSTNLPNAANSHNSIAYFAEQVDERFLERHDLDPQGALYKFVWRPGTKPMLTDIAAGVEKKTRTGEPNTDLQALVTALNKRQTEDLRQERQRFLFDNCNLANLCNYMACRAIIRDTDDVMKNFYLYRDTRGSGEWSLFPWDKDWTFGILGNGGSWAPHPFLGDQTHPKLTNGGSEWNLLMDALFNDPRIRAMYLRRLRTVMDAQLQPASTPEAERWLESRTDHWFSLLQPYKPGQTTATIKSYLAQRRADLYTTYAAATAPDEINRLIPAAQDPAIPVQFGQTDTNPVSQNQDEEFIEILNPNPVAVDLSGWTVSGGIDHTFASGTVIPPAVATSASTGGTPDLTPTPLYLAHKSAAFRARTASPHGGQGLHVQGDWRGSLSARGETLTLTDSTGRIVTTTQTPANPTPAQTALRITKIMYAPPAGGDFEAGEYEYLELRNISAAPLDLSGITFTAGITFTFPAGSQLAPGQRILLVKNPAAFAARYGPGLPIAGTYQGSLANEGERLRLTDAAGEEILDFPYDPAWQPTTLRQGAALVIQNDTAPWQTWSTPTAWRSTTTPHGNPGGPDGDPPATTTPALTLAVQSLQPLTLSAQGTPNITWTIQRSPDLKTWSPIGILTTTAAGTATFTDPNPAAADQGSVFYRGQNLP